MIHRIQDKNNCEDLFAKIKIDNEFIFVPVSKKNVYKIKYKKIILQIVYQRINLFMNFKALKKANLIKVVLKRIGIAKELFIMEMSKGLEVYIPKDLSQGHLPLSMRFYDPII